MSNVRPFTEVWFDVKSRYDEFDCGYSTPCWVWSGCISENGYPRAGVVASCGSQMAHRIFWERDNGPVPAGLDLDHLCRNRACVNPVHLEPVTRSQNLRRSPLVGKRKLSPAQVLEIRGSTASGPELAKRFGVSRTTICQIRLRRTWTELEAA